MIVAADVRMTENAATLLIMGVKILKEVGRAFVIVVADVRIPENAVILL